MPAYKQSMHTCLSFQACTDRSYDEKKIVPEDISLEFQCEIRILQACDFDE